jgi:hypothetical protein
MAALPDLPRNHHLLLARLLQQDPKNESAYYEELGRFIAAYSSAEAQIHTVVRHYSKTDDARARIILGGLRIGDAIDRLRGLLRIPNSTATAGLLFGLPFVSEAQEGQTKQIESCLQQFQLIGQQRDKLVHRQIIYYEDTGFSLSNGQTAKSLASAELRLIVTLQELKNMRLDCGSIYLSLAALLSDEEYLQPWRGKLPPWRDSPPPQASLKPKPPANRRARKRQRRASQRSQEEK